MNSLLLNSTRTLANPKEGLNFAAKIQPTLPPGLIFGFYLYFKKINGIIELQEKIEFVNATNNWIKFILEHDLVACLIYFNQFELLRELFWNEETFDSIRIFLENLDKETQHNYQESLLNIQKNLDNITHKKLDQLSPQEHRIIDESLINIEIYCYFRILEQQITIDYHQNQLVIYQDAYTRRKEQILKVIDIIKMDLTLNQEDKEQFETLHHEYEKEQAILADILTTGPNNEILTDNLKLKHRKSMRVDGLFKERFAKLLGKFGKHTRLKGILQKELNERTKYEGKLDLNEKVYRRESQKISSCLLMAQQTLMVDYVGKMHAITSNLKKFQSDNLDEHIQRPLEVAILRMDKLTNEFIYIDVNEPEKINPKVKQFILEFNRAKALINTQLSLNPEAMEELVRDSELLIQKHSKLDAQMERLTKSHLRINSNDLSERFTRLVNEMEPENNNDDDELINTNIPEEELIDVDAEMKRITSNLLDKLREINEEVEFNSEEERNLAKLETFSKEIHNPASLGEIEILKLKEAQTIAATFLESHPELKELTEHFDNTIASLVKTPAVRMR